MWFTAALALTSLSVSHAERGFADRVIDYTPAPGQFVNVMNSEGFTFGDPTRALGPPVGGGTVTPNNSKLVTLGGFGGSITLGFPQTVLDDPRNPFGVDAIVYGNALFVANNPTRRFAEPATIEIALDRNGNGIPDDPWYLIAAPVATAVNEPLGAFLPPIAAATEPSGLFPTTPNSTYRTQLWDDSAGTPTPPADASWYPGSSVLPGIDASYSTAGFELGPRFCQPVLVHTRGPSAVLEEVLGVADHTPTMLLGDLNADNVIDDLGMSPLDFYTTPDNPFRIGITAGSGGGDGFDIAWAVDPSTGAAARLYGFDFIRITTAVDTAAPLFGERSAEIGGVADVAPDLSWFDVNASGRVTNEDLYAFEQDRGEQDIDRDGRPGTARDRYLLLRAVRRSELGFE